MKPSRRFLTAVMLALALAGTGLLSQAPRQTAAPQTDEAKILEAMHLIQSQPLYNYVAELVSEKYGGRLTGTQGLRGLRRMGRVAAQGLGRRARRRERDLPPALPEPLYHRPQGRRLRDERPGR